MMDFALAVAEKSCMGTRVTVLGAINVKPGWAAMGMRKGNRRNG